LNYLEWNDLIAKYFFNEEKAGREVLLYINEHLLENLGSDQKACKDDFINALKIGPLWVNRQGFCQKALQTCTNWRSRQLNYPPYVGYLSFFVLSAGAGENFAPQAYYPRLWTLLGEPRDKGTPPSFEDMILLWDDLEKWSREDKHETLGRFVARIRGNWWKVGLPLSQTIISEEERNHLSWLFEEANLDPTDSPSPEVMAKTLITHGSIVFSHKTIKLLQSTEGDSSILKQALVELVVDELENWDGIVYEKREAESEEHTRRRMQTAGLRICMNHDAVAQEVKFYFRFKTGKPFPEEELHFERNDDSRIYFCTETVQGWSSPLKYNVDGSTKTLDAVSIDWIQGENFIDKENEWRARLRGTMTRLFRLGIDRLPDWVESQILERGINFYIISSGLDVDKIRNWGVKSCEQFKELKVTGLPHGWVLFYGKNASGSCSGVDVLSISSQLRLLLREGIKAGRGNVFFNFAPPKVVIENGTGNEKVTVNNRQMIHKNISEPVWILPDEYLSGNATSIGEPLRIEIKSENQLLSKIIRIQNFGLPASCDTTPYRSRFGELCSETESPRVRGVHTIDTLNNYSYPQHLPFHLSNKIVFIGRRPGEIAEWPKEGIPNDWQPVWALACKKRNLWIANFCGSPDDIKIESPLGKPLTDRKRLKMWREALWINRRITAEPELPQLKKLWKKYLGVASNV